MFNESMILNDEEMFFKLIQTMPDTLEADNLLRRARQSVIKQKELNGNKNKTSNEYDRLITKINDEIHHISCVREKTNLYRAIRTLYGEDTLNEIVEFIRLNDPRREVLCV